MSSSTAPIPIPILHSGLELQKSPFFSEILDRITDGFFAFDRHWRFVFANKRTEEILKIRRADYIGRTFNECFPGMEDSPFAHAYREAFDTGQPTRAEAFFAPFEAWIAIDVYPSGSGLSVLFRDVTERRRHDEEKKQFEATISQQHALLSGVLERMHEGFFFLDRSLRVTYWNKRMELLTGIKAETILQKDIFELFPPEACVPYRALYERALQNDEVVAEEFLCPVIHHWLHIQVHPSADGLTIFLKDVHEKRVSEEKQRNYERKLREQNETMIQVLEQMQDGFVTLTLEGRVLYWNAQAEVILGRNRKETLGRNLLDIFPHIRDTGVYEVYQRMQTDPTPVHRTIYGPHTNRWFELNAYTTQKGISVFFRDVTRQRDDERTLEQLSLVAKKTSNIVALTDAQQRITWVNEAFTRITGFLPEDAIGRHNGEIFDGPDTDPEVVHFVRSCVADRKPFRVEALNYKKNGETYWADISCQPVFDENGELRHFFSIATDVTERRRLQEQLDEEMRQRQQMVTAAAIKAQESERALVSQELHDNVNQVLTTVKLYTELCRDGIGDQQELMTKSVQLLQRSITEIRSLSKRLSAPSLGNIRLKDSVDELISAVAATNKIQVLLDTDELADGVEVDQEVHLAVYRILQEQLTNVLKHAQAATVEIRFTRKGNLLELRLQDNGQGFDPRRGRNGIGITNMMTRAESVHGFLQLDTAPGQGCTLMVRVPCFDSAPKK
ncbi:MAG: PAS domain S-box protein [Chitinophagaceae bacterium]|nr:MAG: PAS domain S-box protein [Chitinophagaceae bacterium]